jgi:hypothetical protein
MNNQEECRKFLEEYITEEIEKILALNALVNKELQEKEELEKADM